MKDLLERILKELPGYLPELANLVAGPKATIARLVDPSNADLTRPLIFVAVTVGIGFLLQLPQIGKDNDFSTLVASMAVFKVLALIGFAGVIHGCFRAVRGVAPFVATFSVYLYLVSPLYLALVVMEIASLGVLRALDPALAAAARANPGVMFDSPARIQAFIDAAPGAAWSYIALRLAMVALLYAWFIAGWGAFRRVHGVSRARSVLAWVVALIACVPFFLGLNYVLLGMFGSAVPALR